MPEAAQINEIAGEYWDQKLSEIRARTVTRVRWWEDETTKRHINGIVGDPTLTEVHAAFHAKIANRFGRRAKLKAISVGCGVGTKEMWLMQMIDVRQFDLFDVSKANIAFGKEEAHRRGISERVNLHAEDAFAARLDDDYDLV